MPAEQRVSNAAFPFGHGLDSAKSGKGVAPFAMRLPAKTHRVCTWLGRFAQLRDAVRVPGLVYRVPINGDGDVIPASIMATAR
jgi:hypothetical protein